MPSKDEIMNNAVIMNRLGAIARNMGSALEKSARSPIFAEACDFACAILDERGRLASQLAGIPILATTCAASCEAVIAKYGGDIHDGDIFAVNDPYYGGNHLPDIAIIMPVFWGSELVFFCASRAHHGDIGGSAAGSYNPNATEIFQEGIRIPPTRVASYNLMNSEILGLLLVNTRNPEVMRSDLYAQIGSCRIGKEALSKLLSIYGPEQAKRAMELSMEGAFLLARERILALPDGEYHSYELVDDDGFSEGPIKIAVNAIVEGGSLTLDFTGTDSQAKGFINSSVATSNAAAGIAALWALGGDIERNSGAFSAISAILPKGSLLNPYEPAPMTLSTLTPAGEIAAAVLKAMGLISPGCSPAGFGRYSGPSYYGVDPRDNLFYVGFSFNSLGSGGAAEGMDGKPYMAPLSNYGGVKAPNIESNEVNYPHLTLCHEMEEGTGGEGEYRGGNGIRFAFEVLADCEIVMYGDGMKVPPYGLNGGLPGSLNKAWLIKSGKMEVLPSKAGPIALNKGDQVWLVSSGGGGYGDPMKRPKGKVEMDVKNGLISIKTANGIYGAGL